MSTSESNRLYDRYLDACLSGRVEPPEAFCSRYGNTNPSLRRRLDSLYDLHRDNAVRRAEPSPGKAEAGLPFERIGGFRLLAPLGEGGMGRLFLAEQESLGRRVALKLVRSELRGSATALERFRREAFAVAKLQHRHIVRVIATGEDDGLLWIAMELVPGRGLDEVLEEARAAGRPVPWVRVAGWVRALAGAVAYAHGAGVLHRDIKPANIRITPDDEPVLLDFGLARDERWTGKTLTQAFAGSPLYAAPEQIAGRRVDARADVYALGVTLYEACTGRLPFPEGPADQLLHRVLTEEPVPPRRLEPALPRDLEVVTLKALQKSPRDRYAGAAALQADLDAILMDRPISARPPGPLARARRWARRRPWPAATIAAVLLVGLLLAASFVARRAFDARERRRAAATHVAAARERLDAYRKSRESLQETEEQVVDLQQTLHAKFMTDEEDRLLEESEAAVERARREREEAFYEVLDLLRRAEELDPGVEAGAVRAELYLQRWHEARAAGDAVGESFYRDLARRHDAAGRFEETLDARRETRITSDPPGATVHLFSFAVQADVVEGGERRQVPVPARGAPTPVPPGTFALRVVGDAGGLRREDLILDVAGQPVRDTLFVLADAGPLRRGDLLRTVDGAPARGPVDLQGAPRAFVFARGGERIDLDALPEGARIGRAADLAAEGGVEATVFRDGRTWRETLPPGLDVRTTAAPLFRSDACRVGTTPTARFPLEAGFWLVVVSSDGHVPYLHVLHIYEEVSEVHVHARLAPVEAEAPGFRYLAAAANPNLDAFWMLEREVTAAEYQEFLNDPAVLARIEAGEEPVLFPRDSATKDEGGYWPRGPDGRFVLPGDWRPDWPVLGVSWHDAKAYAAWRTERARAAGEAATYRLPTRAEWDLGGCGGTPRNYPWGNRFRPKWTKSCYAHPRAFPEPVLRYPIDESIHGLYDMAGSAAEWLLDWYDETLGLRTVAGGSWANAQPKLFELWGAGQRPDAVSGTLGFRLVRVPEDGK